MTKNIRRIALAGTLALGASWAVASQQQAPPAHPQGHPPGHAMPADKAHAGHSCEEMMARHREMQAKMQAADAELDRLTAAMTAATGDAKVQATAAVVEALVAQRKSMHAMMMEHQPMMMSHMMGHAGKAEGMAGCPMMQEMHKRPASPDPGAQQ